LNAISVDACSVTRYSRCGDPLIQARWDGTVLQDGVEGRDTAESCKEIARFVYGFRCRFKPADDGWFWGGFHSLSGALKGPWAVSVNGNWRVTFTFHGEDAEVVNYLDYH
jgi:hypothetical protein